MRPDLPQSKKCGPPCALVPARPLSWIGRLACSRSCWRCSQAHVSNPRMGLAAHLEGVMNGTFLVALGAIWTELRLPARPNTIAYWLALSGTYGNWLVTTLAAIFGTAALSPITGAGHSGLPWQESLVTLGFMFVGVTIIAATLFALWGLREKALN